MRKILMLVLVSMLPCILHLHVNKVPLEAQLFFRGYIAEPDLFNWWKNALLYSVSGILLIWQFYERKSIGIYRNLIYIYFGMVVLSSILSEYPGIVLYGMPFYLEGTIAIASYCILFLTAAETCLELNLLEFSLGVATVVVFIFGLLQFIDPETFKKWTHWLVFGKNRTVMEMETWPIFSTFMNQNVLGTFSALVYAFFLSRKNWVLTFLSVLLAVASQSRGAWISMVVATVYLAWQTRSWCLTIPILLFCVSFGLMTLNRNNHALSKFSFGSSGRIYVWENTLAILSPWDFFYGYGPGAYTFQFPQDDAKGKIANGWKPTTIVDRPHNFYLQVYHASGGISLIALLALFGLFLVKSKEIAINSAVISYLINVFFTDSCTSVAPLFWILLGTGVSRLNSSKT